MLANAQKRKAFMTVRTITGRENLVSDMHHRFRVQLCCGHLGQPDGPFPESLREISHTHLAETSGKVK